MVGSVCLRKRSVLFIVSKLTTKFTLDGKRTDRQVGHHLVSAATANSNTTCKNGYEFSKRAGGQCVDIDECATAGKNDCHEKNLFCVNSPGSYSCSRCKSGFTFDEQLAVCRDVNECDQQPYPCKAGQSCRNLVGSFRCSCQVRAGLIFVVQLISFHKTPFFRWATKWTAVGTAWT